MNNIPDNHQNRRYAAPTDAGQNLRQSGAGLPQNGTGLRQSGTNPQQSGTNPQQSGTNLPQSGTNPQQSGTGLPQSGTGLRQSGTNPQQSGTGRSSVPDGGRPEGYGAPRNHPNTATMTPQQREAYMRRLEAQRRAQGERDGGRPKYRRRKRGKPNMGIVLFVVLICGVIGVSLYQIGRNPTGEGGEAGAQNPFQTLSRGEKESESASDALTESEDTSDSANESSAETTEPVVEPAISWDSCVVASADINVGDLILVNYEYAYALADTVKTESVYENKTSSYSLSTTAHRLTSTALDTFNRLADAFAADTGLSELLIVSAWRNVESQQSIYDSKAASNGEEYARLYVAQPGYSEHHTGMACDLSFYRASTGASIPVADHEYGYWLNEHCAEYGYILRYPDAKVDITKIAYEPWHYRYVGTPHAAVVMKAELCLEEYVELLKNYTPETTLLHVLSDGTTTDVAPTELPDVGYVVYYVPVSAEQETEIPIPAGYADYTVSGNNADGFIVTVSLENAA